MIIDSLSTGLKMVLGNGGMGMVTVKERLLDPIRRIWAVLIGILWISAVRLIARVERIIRTGESGKLFEAIGVYIGKPGQANLLIRKEDAFRRAQEFPGIQKVSGLPAGPPIALGEWRAALP
jgi:hypothetical protein